MDNQIITSTTAESKSQNEVTMFSHERFGELRVVIKDQEPWFVAADVCKSLDVGNVSMALARLDNDEKGVSSVDTLGGIQQMSIVSEPGLYALTLGSKKPEAKPFKRWITHDVIPSIRKHGMYLSDQINSDMLFQIAERMKRQEEKIQSLSSENAEMLPKARFYDTVTGSADTIDMAQAAKVLNMGVGRNTLFKILRNAGILQGNNVPYQEFVDRGYFRCIESSYSMPDGTNHVNIKTVVFQKGLDFIRKTVELDRAARRA